MEIDGFGWQVIPKSLYPHTCLCGMIVYVLVSMVCSSVLITTGECIALDGGDRIGCPVPRLKHFRVEQKNRYY